MSERDLKPRLKTVARKGVRALQILVFSVAASILPPDSSPKVLAQFGAETASWPALILLDRSGSSLDTDLPAYTWKHEGTFGNFYPVLPNYPNIAHFSYRGDQFVGIDGAWHPRSYKPEDTYQSILESAQILYETVDHLRSSHTSIDLMGYDLGGDVALQYLTDYVMPERGPHSNGVIRSAAFLAANGQNLETARVLRERGVRLMFLTNMDDTAVAQVATFFRG